MHFDWNIDEINELKTRAEVYDEDKSAQRHLERLELHLAKYQDCRSHELRQKIWESVEDEAMDLDRLLDGLKER